MNLDKLEALIFDAKSDYFSIANAFEKFTDSDRKSISQAIQSLHRQIFKNKPLKSASDLVTTSLNNRVGAAVIFWHHSYNRKASLCMYAVAPFSAIKATDVPYRGDHFDAFKRIIETRKPAWLSEWVEWQCTMEDPWIDFPLVWGWYKSGLIPEPKYDSYYTLFANALMATDFYTKSVGKPIRQALEAEPHWITYIPTLFRVESNAFNTNPWLWKGADKDHEMWPEALVKLVHEGIVKRDNLLALTLDGLSQDLKQNQLSGFHKLHTSLSPTLLEQKKLSDQYLDLMDHKVGHVAKFALKHIQFLSKSGELNDSAFISRARDAFIHAAKGNSKLIISIIASINRRRKKVDDDAIMALISALKSEHADTQSVALDILSSANLSSAQKEGIVTERNFLPPSLISKLDNIVGTGYVRANDQSTIKTESIDLNSLGDEALRTRGLDRFQSDPTEIYTTVSSDWRDRSKLEFIEKVEPIEDVSTLIDTIAKAVELTRKPETVYLIVDGISRLNGYGTPDFEAKTSALVKRLKTLSTDWDEAAAHQGIAQTRDSLRRALLSLLMVWLRPSERVILPKEVSTSLPYHTPFIRVLEALTKSVRKSKCTPLLSTPSHINGWLDPKIWVERINLYSANGWEIERNDLLTSLPRLSPGNRQEAYKSLQESALRPLISFVLGQSDKFEAKGDLELWMTAARSSKPGFDWRKSSMDINDDSAIVGGLSPIDYNWSASIEERSYSNYDQTFRVNLFDLNRVQHPHLNENGSSKTAKKFFNKVRNLKSPKVNAVELPYASFHCLKKTKTWYGLDEGVAWKNAWDFTLCPTDQVGVNLNAALCLANTIDEDATRLTHKYSLFEHLFTGDHPWIDSTHLMISLGLSRKEADGRGMAVDVTIHGIEMGFLDPGILASQLIGLSKEPWLKLNRLSQSLQTVSQSSPLHAYVISVVLQSWLSEVNLKTRNIFMIFEILLNAQSVIKQPLNHEFRQILKTIKGSSKAAKLAKSLLEFNEDDADIRKTIRAQAISNRL